MSDYVMALARASGAENDGAAFGAIFLLAALFLLAANAAKRFTQRRFPPPVGRLRRRRVRAARPKAQAWLASASRCDRCGIYTSETWCLACAVESPQCLWTSQCLTAPRLCRRCMG